jgi:hypothetical protein
MATVIRVLREAGHPSASAEGLGCYCCRSLTCHVLQCSCWPLAGALVLLWWCTCVLVVLAARAQPLSLWVGPVHCVGFRNAWGGGWDHTVSRQ